MTTVHCHSVMPTRTFWLLVVGLVLAAFAVCVTTHAVTCTPLPTCADLPQVPAVPVVVQTAEMYPAYALPASLTLPAPVAQGNTVFVAIRAGTRRGHLLSVTDTRGHVYAKVQYDQANDPLTLGLFYTTVETPGPLTITVADSATVGWTRFSVIEVSGLGALARPHEYAEGVTTAVAVPLVVNAGEFVYTMVGTDPEATLAPGPGGTLLAPMLKLFVEVGARTGTLSVAGTWGAIGVAFTPASAATPCATPTPVITWDQVPDADLAAYQLFYNEPGGVPQLLREIPCETYTADDAVPVRVCRGPDTWLPLQRERDFTPGVLYEFCVKAVDATGRVSNEFSSVVEVCFAPLCVSPGPCS